MFQASSSLQWHVSLSLSRHRDDGIFAVDFKHASEHLPEEIEKNVHDALENHGAKIGMNIRVALYMHAKLGQREHRATLLAIHDGVEIESGDCTRRTNCTAKQYALSG